VDGGVVALAVKEDWARSGQSLPRFLREDGQPRLTQGAASRSGLGKRQERHGAEMSA
jgi:hypothetical protein